MECLVKDLLSQIPNVKMKLGSEVISYDAKAIKTGSEVYIFDQVVVAGPVLNKEEGVKNK